jgi:hypothetical protein
MSDDVVHLDQAAKALDVSRRTAERMVEAGQLKGVGPASVSKRSLVALLEERRANAPRHRVATTQELAPLVEAVTDLTSALASQRRQLQAGVDERRALERERADTHLEAERARWELRRLASARFLERRRLLRELRG